MASYGTAMLSPVVPRTASRGIHPGEVVGTESGGIRHAVEEEAVNRQIAPAGPPDGDPRSTAVLILAAMREASAHLGKLLRLARTEVRGNLHALASLVLLFGGALLLVIVSLVLLLIALRDALAVLIGHEAGAALIVASPFLLAMALLGRAAVKRMSLRAPET